MRRVSVRTLVLMVELLMAVVSFQYIAASRQPQPDAVWLANGRFETPHFQSTAM